ncbi:hypothetical protein DDZ18_03165 [Marinicauda salina]|uniref:Spore coat protein U domain-containing protein n=1 Tax=Marinicauda salina TaxID=2135793 RepID=A0A2U2BX70_9PROT|nr:hypothetical protein [Marinicauda salina]PWE18618.1 hypothetical protein DDZ18_03165 [Marinicauda salina]
MKKLLIATAAAAFIAPAAIAQSGGAQITGVVDPVCEVSDLFANLGFASVTQGAQINDGFGVQCNDADGAVLTVISSEGGLESDDNEDFAVPYTATVSGPSFNGSGSTPAQPGPNDVTLVSDFNAFTTGLAAGEAHNLNITLDATGLWAGGYSDTIFVQITAQ